MNGAVEGAQRRGDVTPCAGAKRTHRRGPRVNVVTLTEERHVPFETTTGSPDVQEQDGRGGDTRAAGRRQKTPRGFAGVDANPRPGGSPPTRSRPTPSRPATGARGPTPESAAATSDGFLPEIGGETQRSFFFLSRSFFVNVSRPRPATFQLLQTF